MKISLIILGFTFLIGISICSTDIEPLSIMETRDIYHADGDYFYCISAFENDEMSIDIKVTEDVYLDYTYTYFWVYIKGFSGAITPETMEDGRDYTEVPLGEVIADEAIFRYPFSTIDNVDYLSFHLYTEIKCNIQIYVRSEKASLAVGFIALIVIGCILVCAGIGFGVTFLLRKFGCWVRIHSSSI